MPIFNLVIESLDGEASEKIQLTGVARRNNRAKTGYKPVKGAVRAYQRPEVLQTD